MVVMYADPLPVDAVRDFWDWAGLWASLGTGAVGIVLALLAQRSANKARHETAEAEARTVERAVNERRAVFELEVLRDLAVDIAGSAGDRLAERPELPADGGRLAMLPPGALPTLRSLPTMTWEQRLQLTGLPQSQVDQLIADARAGAKENGDDEASRLNAALSWYGHEFKQTLLDEVVGEISKRVREPYGC